MNGALRKSKIGGEYSEKGNEFQTYYSYLLILDNNFSLFTRHIHLDIELIDKKCGFYIYEIKTSNKGNWHKIKEILDKILEPNSSKFNFFLNYFKGTTNSNFIISIHSKKNDFSYEKLDNYFDEKINSIFYNDSMSEVIKILKNNLKIDIIPKQYREAKEAIFESNFVKKNNIHGFHYRIIDLLNYVFKQNDKNLNSIKNEVNNGNNYNHSDFLNHLEANNFDKDEIFSGYSIRNKIMSCKKNIEQNTIFNQILYILDNEWNKNPFDFLLMRYSKKIHNKEIVKKIKEKLKMTDDDIEHFLNNWFNNY